VIEEGKETLVLPNMSNREMEVSPEYINSSLGLSLSTEQMCHYLRQMLLYPNTDGSKLTIAVPPTRSGLNDSFLISYHIIEIVSLRSKNNY
jgi:phenylalanyl-tRNA synthetase beta subunit